MANLLSLRVYMSKKVPQVHVRDLTDLPTWLFGKPNILHFKVQVSADIVIYSHGICRQLILYQSEVLLLFFKFKFVLVPWHISGNALLVKECVYSSPHAVYKHLSSKKSAHVSPCTESISSLLNMSPSSLRFLLW